MNKNAQRNSMIKKPLLVLDIDETLIHSTTNGPPGDFFVHIPGDYNRYQVHVRPGAKSFLKKIRSLTQFADVGVWTAATAAYASRILDNIIPEWRSTFSFFKTRKHCTNLPNGHLVKDLRRLRDWNDVVLLDDNELNFRFNNDAMKRVMRIKPYSRVNLSDRELSKCGRQIHSCILSGKPLSSICG